MLVGWGVGSGNTIPLEGGWRRFPVPLARLKGGRWGRHLLARCSLEESLLHGNCQASRGTFSKIKYFNKCLPKKKAPRERREWREQGRTRQGYKWAHEEGNQKLFTSYSFFFSFGQPNSAQDSAWVGWLNFFFPFLHSLSLTPPFLLSGFQLLNCFSFTGSRRKSVI